MDSDDVHKFIDDTCKTPTGIWAACLIMVGRLEAQGEQGRLGSIQTAARQAREYLLLEELNRVEPQSTD